MDGERIDALARTLSTGTTRRGVVTLLGGIVATASLLLDPASAGRRKRKRRRRKKRQRNRAASANPSPQPQGGGNDAKNRRGSVCDGADTRACDAAQAGPGLDLSGCNFAEAGFVGASLTGITATRANFAGAHTFGADLASANLDGACFANASLRNANLRGANAAGADFTKADLCGADLRGANISSAQIAAANVCCDTRLPNGDPAVPCRNGRTCCGAGCVDLANDPLSCGQCGHACAAGEVCCAGQCAPPVAGGRCQEGDARCLTHDQDLQAAIDAAPEGGVIFLCAGTWYLEEPVLIGKDLTFSGGWNGGTSTLHGDFVTQVLGIRTNTHVTMTNVTIRGGDAAYGAGLFNQGDLSLGDCTITGNAVIAYGGGIYNEGSLLLVRGSVEENSAYNEDFGYGGYGIYNDEGNVVVQDARIAFNKAERDFNTGDGAGVYNYYGQINAEGSSVITENAATGTGGGIYNDGGTVNLPSSTMVTGNQPNNCAGSAVTNCTG